LAAVVSLRKRRLLSVPVNPMSLEFALIVYVVVTLVLVLTLLFR